MPSPESLTAVAAILKAVAWPLALAWLLARYKTEVVSGATRVFDLLDGHLKRGGTLGLGLGEGKLTLGAATSVVAEPAAEIKAITSGKPADPPTPEDPRTKKQKELLDTDSKQWARVEEWLNAGQPERALSMGVELLKDRLFAAASERTTSKRPMPISKAIEAIRSLGDGESIAAESMREVLNVLVDSDQVRSYRSVDEESARGLLFNIRRHVDLLEAIRSGFRLIDKTKSPEKPARTEKSSAMATPGRG